MKTFRMMHSIIRTGWICLAVMPVISEAQCTADFYAAKTSGSPPFQTTFHDNSSASATAWHWQFPGGTPGSWQGENPPAVTYAQEGVYSVTLNILCNQVQQTRVRTDYIEIKIRYDYGDAPEDQIAYPDLGVIGHFPTCYTGSAGFIRHTNAGHTFLGHHVDYEVDGNASYCPSFEPDMYDMDEICSEQEMGLWAPDVFTIVDGSVIPMCSEMAGDQLGYPCSLARWGDNINLWFDTGEVDGAYVNVIIDWNQDGVWGGSGSCDQGSTPEHILKNFHIPGASNGHLSVLNPPSFRIGPNSGFVWARFTITNERLPLPWNGGGGTYHSGETEDYLLKVGSLSELFDYGDAPRSYLTLLADNGPRHSIIQGIYLGQGVSSEEDGKPTDKADGDDDDGVVFLNDITAGDTARVIVTASAPGKLKVWFDFNGDGDWNDEGEEVVDTDVKEGENTLNIPVPATAAEGQTYVRFRYSGGVFKTPHGPVNGGEIEDYEIDIHVPYVYDFGDAPEGNMAYDAQWVEFSSDDVMGNFATCGAFGRVRHGNLGTRYFGDSVDYEESGNAGSCGSGYDRDELVGDGDAGLKWGHIYQITGDPGAEIITHAGGVGDQMVSCGIGRWGQHLDIQYHCEAEAGAYINVLIDWNMSGGWNDGGMIFHCDDPGAPHLQEHILQDFFVPQGSGYVSSLDPPDFRTGGPGGYVWARFTISEIPVGIDEWTGHGDFADGETEDYLLHVARHEYRDYGDAPQGVEAYPATGVIGNFPTCAASGSNTIRHGNDAGILSMFFGCSLCPPTLETSGNRGMCWGDFNRDDDNGLMYVKTYTLEDGEVVEASDYEDDEHSTIGSVNQMAEWGYHNLDLYWNNSTAEDYAFVNVLIDWNQDGQWGGIVTGPDGTTADEHVLKNYRLPPAAAGSGLRAHREGYPPPDFRIGPNSGYVWARFTIGPNPIAVGPTPWDGHGDFEDGETEDYLLKVGGTGTYFYFDFGDALLAVTENSDGGAMHRIVAGFHLGDLIDGDADGQPGKDASGDDENGINDDDGVEFIKDMIPGSNTEIMVTASAAGILSAWLDFNQNGTWEDEEDHIIKDKEIEEGENTLAFMIPATAAPGTTYVRFRFSDVKGLSFSGPKFNEDPMENPNNLPPIGEVEDYMVVIEGDAGEYDFGDAPDPRYPTLDANWGAWHLKDPLLWMGNLVDTEPDGLPDADARGDDADGSDDEDGVTFHTAWTAGNEAKFSVAVSDEGYLNAWADFNGDGDWNDTGEQIITDDLIPAGSRTYSIIIPVSAWLDSTYVRFRLSRIPGLKPTGYAPDGEVEDYFIAGISSEIQESESLPDRYELKQNQPNPFNPSTQIHFVLPGMAHVRIVVYNLQGQLIQTLMNAPGTAGHHQIQWDGRDSRGTQCTSGIYLYVLETSDFFEAKKLILLK